MAVTDVHLLEISHVGLAVAHVQKREAVPHELLLAIQLDPCVLQRIGNRHKAHRAHPLPETREEAADDRQPHYYPTKCDRIGLANLSCH